MTLYQPTTHDTLVRPGLLFAEWSNIFCKLPGLLPSYIKTDNSAYLPNYLFLALFLLLLFLALSRSGFRKVRGAPFILFFVLFSFSSLFPRPDLTAPHKLLADSGHTRLVHFDPEPAARTDDQGWIFSRPGNYRVLIESRLPLKSIELRLENRSPREPLRLEIAAFDEEALRGSVPAAGTAQFQLPRPPFKWVKNRYFYQLTLRAKVSAASAPPAWLLRIRCR